jgi:hypothetical protein
MNSERAIPPKPRPQRLGWARFSLRTLLAMVSLLAVALAGFAYWRDGKRREEAAADWLLNHGASVAHLDGWPLEQRPLWVQRLAIALPEYCLLTVYWVDFPKDTTDAELAILDDLPNLTTLHLDHAVNVTPAGLTHLRSLKRLEVLYLKETPAGDAGLAHADHLHGLKEIWIEVSGITDASVPWIASNPNLTHLDLDCAQITDKSLPLLATLEHLEVLALRATPTTSRGLAELSKLPRLQHLYLKDTAIDDDGLWQLEKIKSLQTLDVRRTRVTAAGLKRFQRAQPQCRLEDY